MKEEAIQIVRILQNAGFTAFFAGGCVRDILLKKEPHDIDIATSATPDQVQSLFKEKASGLIGKSFGVIRVKSGAHFFEVATFRTDIGSQGGRWPKAVQFSTPREDALRRDFTINGIFYDPLSGTIIDYVGGSEDIEKKRIRAIGDPKIRFEEDHLRLLRAIRFAVRLGFSIEEKTWEAIQSSAHKITQISPERIREELDKIFTGPDPARGLELLDQSGLLRFILPEISNLHGVEQPKEFHPEGDVFNHVLLVLSHLHNPSLELALAALFHDVGKAVTFSRDNTGQIHFYGHETVGAQITEKIMTRLRYSKDIIKKVVECVRNHMSFKDVPRMKKSTLKKLILRPTFPIELELHRIDCLSSHGDLSIYNFLIKIKEQYSAESLSPPKLITGFDLLALGLKPGKKVGEILERIREAQLEDKISSRAEALLMAEDLIRNELVKKNH
ncbi:CCA tRNA nucleotidyltransferase [Candidatus Methylacidiphilum infernorum]|uniref:CCA tRNA nucleotidyltransferase n=1 Tax=Candidatus Methylacidiphilum infernorum TaxID=511746 RepID=A0ABX7PX25_9BACT|nr:CCA tRNA nucleotidyltransferase [Candidatus Methylacidiphilum infernorum]QSR87570.1 CCA tRNA nucleotidyltransferase [Candidatus Methylacidiphilum infernorum]